MSEEDIPEKRLKKLTGTEDLSTTIKKLEKKKTSMEDDFRNEMHYFFENLNPINVLNRTLQNVKESSSSKYSLFKEALTFGAGYLSKRNLMHQLERAFIKTFKNSVKHNILNSKAANDYVEDRSTNENLTDQKNANFYMDSQNEKVKAKPEVLPEPTYLPFFFAMGIAFLGWGLLTTWLISLAGFIILIISLTGWINILRHE